MSGKTELLETFFAIGRALSEKNIAALLRLYAPDFRNHGLHGEVETREDILKSFGPAGVYGYRMADVEVSAEVHGETGLIYGCGSVFGQIGKTEFSHRVRFLEVYLWREARWQCYRTQCTEVRTLPDVEGPAR